MQEGLQRDLRVAQSKNASQEVLDKIKAKYKARQGDKLRTGQQGSFPKEKHFLTVDNRNPGLDGPKPEFRRPKGNTRGPNPPTASTPSRTVTGFENRAKLGDIARKVRANLRDAEHLPKIKKG